MKILYGTYRHDPTNPDLGSGRDYEAYQAMVKAGHDVEILGPVTAEVNYFERIEAFFWKIYKRVTGKSGLKFLLSTSLKASRMAKKAMESRDNDLIISAYFPFFVFYKPATAAFWFFDTTFHGQEEEWPLYGRLALKITYWQERRALRNVEAYATNSEWSRKQVVNYYGIKNKHVTVFPMPSAIPAERSQNRASFIIQKELSSPLRLLLVGRVFKRKGIDIALEVVQLLNAQGIPTVLKICGLPESEQQKQEHVEYVGPFKKSDPDQLREYMDLYGWAHLLIHPARFEAAGIVPSEAAAFGTPTITNNTGGLGTSVLNGVSGIVLPKGSPPETYVQAIIDLISDPARYYALCQSTLQRYERELNWGVAGPKLVAAIESAVQARKLHSETLKK